MLYLHHTYTKKYFVVFLKFCLTWASWISLAALEREHLSNRSDSLEDTCLVPQAGWGNFQEAEPKRGQHLPSNH